MVDDTRPDPAKVIWQLDNVDLLEVFLFHPVVIFPMKLSISPFSPFDELLVLGGELEGVRVKAKGFATKLFLHRPEVLPQTVFPDNAELIQNFCQFALVHY